MTPFKKFMLQAQGLDPDLEEKLQAERFRNLDRYFQIVFGQGLRPNERRLVESIATALNTTVDDEYVMQIFVAGRGVVASHKLAEEVSAAKEVLVQANDQHAKLYAKQTTRDSYLIWACVVLVFACLVSNGWTAHNLRLVSDRVDVIGSVTKH